MKIKFVLGPYGYEVVLGNISEQVYNKYSQDKWGFYRCLYVSGAS